MSEQKIDAERVGSALVAVGLALAAVGYALTGEAPEECPPCPCEEVALLPKHGDEE